MSERLSITKNGAKLNEAINKTLEEIKASGTFKEERVITSKQAAEIAVEGREEKVLNFCANNYLGLANSPELIQAAKESLGILMDSDWLLSVSSVEPLISISSWRL